MKAIAAALAAARGEFQRARKDGKNPHLKNSYPTLDAMVEAVEPALVSHGLTYWQPVVMTKAGPVVRTVLFHLESGESLKCDVPLLTDGGAKINPMQAMGSAITYSRRYGLETLLGVMREDDDGHGAYAPRDQHRPQQQRPPQQGNGKPADEFDRWLDSAAAKLGINRFALVGHFAKTFSIEGDRSNHFRVVRGMWETAEDRLDLLDECRRYQAELASRQSQTTGA